MNQEYQLFLNRIAYNLRVSSLISTTAAQSGHPTTCLSAAEIMAVLFFDVMHFDPKNHSNPDNDRFILSKGHAAPILYAVYKELGILSEQDLLTLRTFDSVLEGHPTLRFPYSEAATGSLGQGLSIGLGMALAARLDKREYTTYVLLGDGEMAEGSVWEAFEIAAYYHMSNLRAIIDCNKLGQSEKTMHAHHISAYVNKVTAFGWHPFVVDGHNVQELSEVLQQAQKYDQPVCIIAKTIKGYGIPQAEDKQGFHGKAFSKSKLPHILKDLKKRFSTIAEAHIKYSWYPKMSQETPSMKSISYPISMAHSTYTLGDMIKTREAFGHALTALGDVCPEIVSLDGDVKNSTYTYLFEKKYPTRFIQCFIAEQNMVGMGVGLVYREKLPFIATFSCFMTRAFDQLRMAAIGTAPLRVCGSHAGVSVGEDGPSQMGLEDIALFSSLPNSIILYPSDAVSTHKLVKCMANYTDGISYLRTTRMATPVRYNNTEPFTIGGCKVLQQTNNDVACIVAAGITVAEALNAYETLQKEGIFVSVIDLYSIKPFDVETVKRMGKKSHNKIITVEDHYLEGGIGYAVSYALRNSGITIECLAVTKLPRSGKPATLLNFEEIDAEAIISHVKN